MKSVDEVIDRVMKALVAPNTDKSEDPDFKAASIINGFMFGANDDQAIYFFEKMLSVDLNPQTIVTMMTVYDVKTIRGHLTMMSVGLVQDTGIGLSDKWPSIHKLAKDKLVASLIAEGRDPKVFEKMIAHVFKNTEAV
jgi:hypothetical protein